MRKSNLTILSIVIILIFALLVYNHIYKEIEYCDDVECTLSVISQCENSFKYYDNFLDLSMLANHRGKKDNICIYELTLLDGTKIDKSYIGKSMSCSYEVSIYTGELIGKSCSGELYFYYRNLLNEKTTKEANAQVLS